MINQIDVRELAEAITRGEPIYLVDVRQPWEHQLAALPNSTLLPLGELALRADELSPPLGALVVTYCHHGIRSLDAAAFLSRKWTAMGPKVASLAGGIDRWSIEIDPTIRRY